MSLTSFEEFLSSNAIDEVECLVPDMSGTARGKILPPTKFQKGSKIRGLRIPEEVFTLTINGRYFWKSDASDSADRHLHGARSRTDPPACPGTQNRRRRSSAMPSISMTSPSTSRRAMC